MSDWSSELAKSVFYRFLFQNKLDSKKWTTGEYMYKLYIVADPNVISFFCHSHFNAIFVRPIKKIRVARTPDAETWSPQWFAHMANVASCHCHAHTISACCLAATQIRMSATKNRIENRTAKCNGKARHASQRANIFNGLTHWMVARHVCVHFNYL